MPKVSRAGDAPERQYLLGGRPILMASGTNIDDDRAIIKTYEDRAINLGWTRRRSQERLTW
jgi:hypothetical protein